MKNIRIIFALIIGSLTVNPAQSSDYETLLDDLYRLEAKQLGVLWDPCNQLPNMKISIGFFDNIRTSHIEVNEGESKKYLIQYNSNQQVTAIKTMTPIEIFISGLTGNISDMNRPDPWVSVKGTQEKIRILYTGTELLTLKAEINQDQRNENVKIEIQKSIGNYLHFRISRPR
ncbi:MAG: hypothetical protein LBJ92_00345 [Holosporales bacterium]|jgi:hypothetical protein|nr:hypothetical protein [Holosporales bacterium]